MSLAPAKYGADWCEFLDQHARKLYAAELRTDRVAAHALSQNIRQGVVSTGMTLCQI